MIFFEENGLPWINSPWPRENLGERSPVCFWVQSYNIQEAESSFMCIKMCIAMCIKICITTHITIYITICITMYITHLLTPSFSALCAATPTCTASDGHIYSLSPPYSIKPTMSPLFPPYAPNHRPLSFPKFPHFPLMPSIPRRSNRRHPLPIPPQPQQSPSSC